MQDSLDNISEQLNEEYSKAFFQFFKEKLDLPGNRGYITYIDPGRANMGYVPKHAIAFLIYIVIIDMMGQPLPQYLARNEE